MNSILSAQYNKSANTLEYCPVADRPEFAFIGRSNVGKSTLINLICRKKELAKTSAKPGKTQLINYFDIISGTKDGEQQSWYLVDLPGYGYAKATKDRRAARGDMISDYLIQKTNLTHIFVLIDSRIKPQAIDIDFVQWMYHEGKDFSLVFTKSDKSTQKEVSATIKAFMTAISAYIQPTYFVTSALKQLTIQPIRDSIHEMSKNFIPDTVDATTDISAS